MDRFSNDKPSRKRTPALQFIRDLSRDASMERQPIESAGLPAGLEQLRLWQTRRLASTYQDFSQDPRYGPACQFFLEEVYAPQDFSQRDHDFDHLYQLMLRFVPESMLGLIREAIELNQFSNQLDLRLLAVLSKLSQGRLQITPGLYAEAYRVCDNYPDRVDQINRIIRVLEAVAVGARNPLVMVTLKLARGPAVIAGWGDLQGFLVRGCLAFSQMKGGSRFIQAVHQRETRILNLLFDADPDPFDHG